MSTMKLHRPRYRIAAQLRRGPGLSVAHAVRRAEAAVAELREALLAEVDTQIALAEAAIGDGLAGDRTTAERIYDSADRLAGVAGACGFPAVAEAALGACDLIDWMREVRWEPKALAVHVAALRVLRGGASGLAAAQVLEGLTRVRAHLFEPGAGA